MGNAEPKYSQEQIEVLKSRIETTEWQIKEVAKNMGKTTELKSILYFASEITRLESDRIDLTKRLKAHEQGLSRQTFLEKAEKKIFEGMLSTYLTKSGMLESAPEANFYAGVTWVEYEDLNETIEGRDALYTVVLRELVNHKEALQNGKRVDVHCRWQLSKDRSSYESVELLKTEINEMQD